MAIVRYFAGLGAGKAVLWCYLIWYLVSAVALFDPSPAIWLNSAGISLIIGLGLQLSVTNHAAQARDRWQTFRLFLMPFCVSSFSSLIKGQGYVFIFPTKPALLAASTLACAMFLVAVVLLRIRTNREGG